MQLVFHQKINVNYETTANILGENIIAVPSFRLS